MFDICIFKFPINIYLMLTFIPLNNSIMAHFYICIPFTF